MNLISSYRNVPDGPGPSHPQTISYSYILGEFLRDKMYNSIPGLSKPTEDQKAASLQLFEQIAGGALRSS